jgi:hypothetical protein
MSSPAECKNYGRASADGNVRLYTRAECDSLNGVFYAGGECTKKGGGSWSWECRELNKQTSSSATCLAGDASSIAFQEYIRSCRNNINKNDDAIANNFLTETINKYKDIFEHYRAEYTDLMIATENVQSSMQSPASLEEQIGRLQAQKSKLTNEISKYRTISNAADKGFLEDIYNGTPKEKMAPTLQDFALLLFWFSWLVMSVVLISVRVSSPSGGWRSGLFVFVILLLVTLCMFSIISYSA